MHWYIYGVYVYVVHYIHKYDAQIPTDRKESFINKDHLLVFLINPPTFLI